MQHIQPLLIELDGLKSVYRKSYLSDSSRTENSAEHSWHLAMTLMSLKQQLPKDLDIDHAIKLALVHDICEIGAGDICAYDPDRADKTKDEDAYLTSLAARYPNPGNEIYKLWAEYESQLTVESHWVKVVDRLLPFLLNLATEGKTWQEQKIDESMVRRHNDFIKSISPEIHEWMMGQLKIATDNGWLATY